MGIKTMPQHDKPVCSLTFPSRKPDIVVKMLKAEAYRALADQMLGTQGAISRDTVKEIRKYLTMAELFRDAALFEVQETAEAGWRER